MSRTYDDPIDVRRAGRPPSVPAPEHPGPAATDLLGDRPVQFLWRGRLYIVRAVLAHWIEATSWWGGSRRSLEGEIPPHEHELWRVEARVRSAGNGRSDSTGIYDLRRDLAADRWALVRTMD